MFLTEAAQHNHVDHFQLFAKFYNNSLPTKFSAEQENALEDDPQLLEFKFKVQILRAKDSSQSEISDAQNEVRSYRTRLIKDRTEEYILKWVRDRRDWMIITQGK